MSELNIIFLYILIFTRFKMKIKSNLIHIQNHFNITILEHRQKLPLFYCFIAGYIVV